jgi:endonuclease G
MQKPISFPGRIASKLLVLLLAGFSFTYCSKHDNSVAPVQDNKVKPYYATAGFDEDFETGSKTAYAAANVTLGTGTWNMNDALIGTLSSDAKTGSASARIRNTGSVTMEFDKTTGAGTVTIDHAKYGTDGSSTWQLWESTNSGSTWTQVGSTITTSSTSLSTASFTVNVSGNIRFDIRKVSGGTNRINIDNITITDYSTSGGGTGGGSSSEHMVMGNPSGATTNTSYPTNYYMEKTQYCLSYNRDKGTPNWTAWHLSSSWLGSATRQNDFRADATLPTGWYEVSNTDYSSTGFDRGHMCPSGDRTDNTTDNSATFLMTNMVPQAPQNNQNIWADLEDYCRSLVSAGNELYIYSGPYGSGGSGSNGGTTYTIANGKVTVPAYVWKIIVVLPDGSNDLSRVSTSTRVIAVKIPNTQAVGSDSWGDYRVSVDALETLTGYDFLSNVSTTIQSTIESSVDSGSTI